MPTIPITTPHGTFQVFTERHGSNPTAKLLLLHGGPGFCHEYLEAFDAALPAAGIEFHHYDQLGSHESDQPDIPELWEIERFVDEVEQVRQALGLDAGSFFLYGHSWGGILAIEYALRYQQHCKGLIVSNMMSSVPAYNRYADEVLKPAMDQAALAEIERLEADGQTDEPRYMQLLIEHHYVHHILRRPFEQWPAPVLAALEHVNPKIYVPMQGPSELGMRGRLASWDRSADLHRITIPTLTIGARHDTMDPSHMEWMAGQFPAGRHHHCPDGSHLALWDDSEVYFRGLVEFVRQVDGKRGGSAAGSS